MLQNHDDSSICSIDLAILIVEHRDRLTLGERLVAEVVLSEPQTVAFGTLASVAESTGTSGTSIIRLAAKLGMDGFGELRSRVQEELAAQLRPAQQRIREPGSRDVVALALAFELESLQDTLGRVDRAIFNAAAMRIAECSGQVLIMAAECAAGVGELLADQLAIMRDGVTKVGVDIQRIGQERTQKSHRAQLQGKPQPVVITAAASD